MPLGGSFRERVAPLYDEGEAIVEYIKATQHVRPDELEVLSLVEPHKLKQNGLTLVRRTGRPSA